MFVTFIAAILFLLQHWFDKGTNSWSKIWPFGES